MQSNVEKNIRDSMRKITLAALGRAAWMPREWAGSTLGGAGGEPGDYRCRGALSSGTERGLDRH